MAEVVHANWINQGTDTFDYNVKHAVYGALGNGIANDTAPVQVAINAAIANGGGHVYFPKGRYLVGDLTIGSNITLMGSGWGTILEFVSGATYILSANPGTGGTTSVADNIKNVKVEKMELRGRSVSDGFSEHKHLLNLNAVSDVLVENVKFTAMQGDGIYLGSSNAAATERHNERVTVRKCHFDGVNYAGRNGITFIDCNDLTIDNNYFTRIGFTGMPGCIDGEPDGDNPWVTGTAYIVGGAGVPAAGSVVQLGGTAYTCTVAHTSGSLTEPGVGADWATVWVNSRAAHRFPIIKKVRITNNKMENCPNIAGIALLLRPQSTINTPQNDFVIENNNVVNCLRGYSVNGEAVAGGAVDTAPSYDVTIYGGTVKDCTQTFYMEAVKGLTMEGVVYEDCGQTADLGYSYQINDVRIKGNTFRRCGWQTLAAWNSGTTYPVKGYATYAAKTWRALVSNTNVTPVEGATWTAVAFYGNTNAINVRDFDKLYIEDNTFDDCGLSDNSAGRALFFSGTGSKLFHRNNTYISPTGRTTYAIGVSGTLDYGSVEDRDNRFHFSTSNDLYGKYGVKTAIPSTGTWAVGDVVYNKTPADGQASEWRCTAAGTPGTWVPVILNGASAGTSNTWTDIQTFTGSVAPVRFKAPAGTNKAIYHEYYKADGTTRRGYFGYPADGSDTARWYNEVGDSQIYAGAAIKAAFAASGTSTLYGNWQLSGGTWDDAAHSANIGRLATAQTWSAAQTFTTGAVPDVMLTSNVARLATAQTWTATQTFGTVKTGAFGANGAAAQTAFGLPVAVTASTYGTAERELINYMRELLVNCGLGA